MAAYALTWMPDVLRKAGLRVEEVGDWRNHGHGNMSAIRGVLLHHTAGPATGNYPSQSVVTNGRPGLAGPLCNLGLARDGTWKVIAAGLGYHAGSGYVSWCGRDNGNNHLIGVEAESTGRGDWTSAQLESYPRGVAALLRHLGLGPERALAHKEWAPGRKIDPAGWPGDMKGFRESVAEWMAGKTPGGFLMALSDEQQADLLEMLTRIYEQLAGSGARDPNDGFPGWALFDGSGRKLTIVDMMREMHRELNQRLEARDGSKRKDTLLGHVLNAGADQATQRALLQGQATILARIADGVQLDEGEMKRAFADALAEERDALAAEISARSAQLTADELRPQLLEIVNDDNRDQAEEFLRALTEKLAANASPQS